MGEPQANQTPIDRRSEMSWIRRFVDKGDDPPMLFLLLIACLFLGSGYLLTTLHEDKFEKNVGAVIEKNADWDFVEVDGPGCGDEYSNCNKITKIQCFADLVVQHNVDGINYTSQVDDWFLYSEKDRSNAEQSCEEFVKNSTLEIGSNTTIFFDKEDPTVAYKEVPYPGTWIAYTYLFGILLSGFWVLMAIILVLKKLGGSKKQQLSEWESALNEHDDKIKR
tara:strand:- start:181 stop:846 length:666 start_codon:yes stop_codon:yes gene_type:complete